MIKIYALLIIMGLRVAYNPSSQARIPALHCTSPATLISFRGIVDKNKCILHWVVGSNETADQFQVERSTNGKNFKTVALAFGSDQKGTYDYEFYENVGKEKSYYRIKLISKDQRSEYSKVMLLGPSV